MTSDRWDKEQSNESFDSYLYRVMFSYCGASEVFGPEGTVGRQKTHDNVHTLRQFNCLFGLYLMPYYLLTTIHSLFIWIKINEIPRHLDFNTDRNSKEKKSERNQIWNKSHVHHLVFLVRKSRHQWKTSRNAEDCSPSWTPQVKNKKTNKSPHQVLMDSFKSFAFESQALRCPKMSAGGSIRSHQSLQFDHFHKHYW